MQTDLRSRHHATCMLLHTRFPARMSSKLSITRVLVCMLYSCFSPLRQVHLPTGFGVEMATVDTTANKRFAGGIVDRCTGDADCTVRPGPHTYNGSYTKLTTRIRGTASAPTLSVMTESAHVDGANGHAVVVRSTPLSTRTQQNGHDGLFT